MLEAICFQTRDVLEAMQADSGTARLPVMFVDGGASQNDLLMQVGGGGLLLWHAAAAPDDAATAAGPRQRSFGQSRSSKSG